MNIHEKYKVAMEVAMSIKNTDEMVKVSFNETSKYISELKSLLHKQEGEVVRYVDLLSRCSGEIRDIKLKEEINKVLKKGV